MHRSRGISAAPNLNLELHSAHSNGVGAHTTRPSHSLSPLGELRAPAPSSRYTSLPSVGDCCESSMADPIPSRDPLRLFMTIAAPAPRPAEVCKCRAVWVARGVFVNPELGPTTAGGCPRPPCRHFKTNRVSVRVCSWRLSNPLTRSGVDTVSAWIVMHRAEATFLATFTDCVARRAMRVSSALLSPVSIFPLSCGLLACSERSTTCSQHAAPVPCSPPKQLLRCSAGILVVKFPFFTSLVPPSPLSTHTS
jgi:hypothetical protein